VKLDWLFFNDLTDDEPEDTNFSNSFRELSEKISALFGASASQVSGFRTATQQLTCVTKHSGPPYLHTYEAWHVEPRRIEPYEWWDVPDVKPPPYWVMFYLWTTRIVKGKWKRLRTIYRRIEQRTRDPCEHQNL
jgi:hypothetical protein